MTGDQQEFSAGRQPPRTGGAYGGRPAESFVNPLAHGPRYSYDKKTLTDISKEFEDLANEFREDQQYAQNIARAKAPGLDYASENNAETIRDSGKALLVSLVQQEQYCRDQAKKYRAALGEYTVAEDTHSTEVRKAGGSL
ncbi:hypothetical protein G3I59_30300 [Amycolatopsis rubida]|uniref:PE domain-containing protein n=1 Tax=Amycolatopsis rubida TaxID=112413 RepID=A0ABX0C4E7_9PSEU|nr:MULTISPECIES: hypothetical protein [Amycolatopsis]MYW94771.1 hypothetical protein [Amycolatopsis rubida]NEC59758.1 hypothetical protein [Amycolatopsis rubida]OAP23508.1 hypothetical protein A4R44_05706 [Amycolatopsis sp. M39]